MSEIVNRVANSTIATINLDEIYPQQERVVFDIKPFLFQELVLREKDFRAALKEMDWSAYHNKWVAITCTADAIVPTWAYMLVATYMNPVCLGYVIGDMKELEMLIADQCLDKINVEALTDRPVVVKGCSGFPIPLYAYGKIISMLQSRVKSIMYGEPCSTVPLYKKQKS